MSRMLKLTYLSMFALLVVTFVFGQAAPREQPKAEVKADEPIYVRFDKVVIYNGQDDPKISLAEELQTLGAQHNLVFDINERAFNFDNIQEVGRTPIFTNPLPPMKNVRLETVLRKILDRVPGPSGAVFTIRRDRIEITTGGFQEKEFWPHAPADMEPVFPLVHANYEKKPLDEALKDLADRTDVTIVLDVKAAEKDKPVVTARLANTPLDAAVQLLAEMSDLRAVTIGKTMFVTSVEKAKRMTKQPRMPMEVPVPGMPPNPLGALGALGMGGQLGAIGIAPPPGFRPRSTSPGAM